MSSRERRQHVTTSRNFRRQRSWPFGDLGPRFISRQGSTGLGGTRHSLGDVASVHGGGSAVSARGTEACPALPTSSASLLTWAVEDPRVGKKQGTLKGTFQAPRAACSPPRSTPISTLDVHGAALPRAPFEAT